MEEKCSVAVVGNWSSMNYGAQLTYYALYQTLFDEGFKVAMIEGSKKNSKEVLNPGLFRKNPYEQASLIKTNVSEMKELNEEYDSYIVGSDQLWRYIFFKDSLDANLLSFVSSDKRKLSYATSFGEKQIEAPLMCIERMKFFLSRFQRISVREKSGVDICRETFGVNAECVLDPVFLCDVHHYENLIHKSAVLIDKPFVFVYIVHPSPEKRDVFTRIMARMGKKVVFVRSLYDDNYEDWDVHFESDCKIEEWLYYIKNCDTIITDSFHAYCFSIIFNKQVIPLFQTVSGVDSAERVFSLVDILGIKSPETIGQCNVESLINYEIDYVDVNMLLKMERMRCKGWLLDALETDVTYDRTDLLCDMLMMEVYKRLRLEQKIAEQTREINRLKYNNRKIVLFGAGRVLEQNYHKICGDIEVCVIVDNNAEKWGVLYDGIKCVSPKQILELDNPHVIITVSDDGIVADIKSQLNDMGIIDATLLSDWIEL